ncbi:hypothetical protein [Streptomyces pini]|uniref:Uncharacterized protein n=1 Tax=Streptomyces pini TaxID=1520580 RepID=A0A1I3TRS5_9ACTN|nr:hypothetical protein [Streptomyces pini]SFJ73495.1 hypothetical protein SAMN05192584_10152 [Streptomyces pini]
MLDVTPLLTAVDRFADRLRAMPQSSLARGAAAEGLGLAGELADRAQRLEFPGRPPRPLPDAGLFAVGDQLAVAGHDLAEALRTAGERTGAGPRELAGAVALVEAAESAALEAALRARR